MVLQPEQMDWLTKHMFISGCDALKGERVLMTCGSFWKLSCADDVVVNG